ncbi:MAG: site-specific integrase [Planctomycetota bacterium]
MEAQERYQEVLADLLAGKLLRLRPRIRQRSSWPTVSQLAAEFLVHARRFYRDPDQRVGREVGSYTGSLRPLLELFGDAHVDQFSVTDLLAVRQRLVDCGRYCRKTINGTIRRCKAIFRWGAEIEAVPAATWHQLSSLRGLTAGRGGVRESVPVQPVPWGMVEPALPHLLPPLRAAVLLQWYTGLRPTEALQITRGQIEMFPDMWLYRPAKHKGVWRGLERMAWLGPKAQEVLTPLLKVDPDAALISPVDAVVALKERKRRDRKTPITKQTRDRDRRSKKKRPYVGQFYGVDAYRKAIHRACDDAGVPCWSPHQLRHAAARRIALEAGLEACKAVLGHQDMQMTQRYAATADVDVARATAAKHG